MTNTIEVDFDTMIKVNFKDKTILHVKIKELLFLFCIEGRDIQQTLEDPIRHIFDLEHCRAWIQSLPEPTEEDG